MYSWSLTNHFLQGRTATIDRETKETKDWSSDSANYSSQATVIMYVQVRMMDTGVSVTIPTSRTTVLKEFKKLVEDKFNIKPENQRLFFAGKQVRTTNWLSILVLIPDASTNSIISSGWVHAINMVLLWHWRAHTNMY